MTTSPQINYGQTVEVGTPVLDADEPVLVIVLDGLPKVVTPAGLVHNMEYAARLHDPETLLDAVFAVRDRLRFEPVTITQTPDPEPYRPDGDYRVVLVVLSTRDEVLYVGSYLIDERA